MENFELLKYLPFELKVKILSYYLPFKNINFIENSYFWSNWANNNFFEFYDEVDFNNFKYKKNYF